jgi:hypothetical protein
MWDFIVKPCSERARQPDRPVHQHCDGRGRSHQRALHGNRQGLFNTLGLECGSSQIEFCRQSPEDFGIGVVKGVGSLVKNIVYGGANTASSITGSIGNAFAVMSLDDDYLKRFALVLRILSPPETVCCAVVASGG